MDLLRAGTAFPPAKLKGVDENPVEFPEVFRRAPATVVFFYRGQW